MKTNLITRFEDYKITRLGKLQIKKIYDFRCTMRKIADWKIKRLQDC